MELQDQNNEIPTNYQGAPGLSRRSFLKRIGAVALGAVAASALTPEDIQAATTVNKRTFIKASNIALGSQLYTRAVNELAALGFVIDSSKSLDFNTLLTSPEYPALVGLVFTPIKSPGYDRSQLFMTIDLTTSTAKAANYTVLRQSTGNGGDISITLLDQGERLENKGKASAPGNIKSLTRTQYNTNQEQSDCNWVFECAHWGNCNGIYRCLVYKKYKPCTGETQYFGYCS
jgi:hypothetical protein